VRRGLLVVELAAKGRGKASTLALPFAAEGPWWDGDINAELFEAVLGYSRAQGSARLLVAALAALSDERGVVAEVTTEQLCAAAGVSDRTYRRMHGPLLASGEVVAHSSTGGRGNTNRWEIPDPRAATAAAALRSRRRVAPPAGVRPLIATVGVAKPSAASRAVRTGWFGRRTVRACQGFRRQTAVRTGQFRPRTVQRCQGFRP
jgi:hypothetical protein